MVRRIKKKRKKAKQPKSSANDPGWLVPFDAEGRAGIYIHKHGESDDHSACGPVVMCCERSVAPYRKLAPDLHETVTENKPQPGSHLSSWLDNGVQAMYFVLCDPDDTNVVYQFGLNADAARDLLLGHVSYSAYRRPDYRYTAE